VQVPPPGGLSTPFEVGEVEVRARQDKERLRLLDVPFDDQVIEGDLLALLRRRWCGSRNGDRRRGGNAPLLLEHLGELGSLQDGQCGQLVHQLREIGHFCMLLDLMA
jgi:hypothetical protein